MNNPPSSEILYLRHSKARIVVASEKVFITGYNGEMPQFSRPIDVIKDVIVPTAKKLRNQ